MSDFQLEQGDQVVVNISTTTGVGLDAGSVAASFADATEWTTTIAADQSSITVEATGALVVGDLLTVTGTIGGTAVTPGTLSFDEVAVPAITLTPGAVTPIAAATPPVAPA